MHEHLDAFGLINMPARPKQSEGGNGRMYDPWLGRFLSPDPSGYAPAPLYWETREGKGSNMNQAAANWLGNYSSGYGNYTHVDLDAGNNNYEYAGGGEFFNHSSGEFVGYDEVFQNYIVPNSTSLPTNTNLSSIEFSQENGVEGTWYQTSSWGPMRRIGEPGSDNFSVQSSSMVSLSFVAFGEGSASGGWASAFIWLVC